MPEALQYSAVTLGTIILIMATVAIHVIALFVFRRAIARLATWDQHHPRHHATRETVLVGLIVVGLCAVHILEVIAWAVGYLAAGALHNFDDAFYFSLTTYTTVGATGVAVSDLFRSFAGIESLLGPIMLAWSTAFLVDILHQFPAPPQRHGTQRPDTRKGP